MSNLSDWLLPILVFGLILLVLWYLGRKLGVKDEWYMQDKGWGPGFEHDF